MLARELLAEYKHLAWQFFKGGLRPAAIELVETTSRLGGWIRATRTIEISRPLVLAHPWGVVVEVLKHEIAHQYAHEVLGAHDESAHGPAFRLVCERLGIDSAASGVPDANGERNPIVEKVARLLALAESPERHEAEAAMAAAQRLMLKYNIEHATGHLYGFRQLGSGSGRTTFAERTLGTILTRYFFVDAIWMLIYRPLDGKRGSMLEICGAPENLAMAEHVYHFLTETAERLFQESGLTRRHRRNYLSGVMSGFEEKLRRQAHVHEKEGLVWVRDADLNYYYRQRHPHVRHVRYGGALRTRAFEHGKEAGGKIVLARPMRGEGAEGRRGVRLLGK